MAAGERFKRDPLDAHPPKKNVICHESVQLVWQQLQSSCAPDSLPPVA